MKRVSRLARGFVLVLCAVVSAVSAVSPVSAAAAAPAAPETGGAEIAARQCASCHSFTADEGGDLAALASRQGPGLGFAGSKFRREWLEAWLQEPRRLRPAGYLPFRYTVGTPQGDRVDAALLPVHPRLGPAEARAVAAYLASLRKELQPFPSAEPNGAIRAEVHFGKILPCGGCHQARPGVGGVSGPELYSAAERLNRDWALSFIADPVYWRKGPMPRLNVRSDQLAALGEYIFTGGGTVPPPLGAAALGAAPAAAPAPLPAGDRGAVLYRVLCSQCHGVQGNGKGINAPFLFVSPRDHSSFDEMNALTDERIFSAIKRGGASVGKSTLMPSWGGVLADDDIHLLVDYLRRLSKTEAH
jgi:mono/diheme cytochrome c family protein